MLPHDENAERAVLGAILLDNSKLGLIENAIAPEDFYRPEHGRVFDAMRELVRGGSPADEVTVSGRIGASLMPFLVDLLEQTPSAANIGAYARCVRNKALARNLIAIGHDLQVAAHEDEPKAAIEATSKRLYELTESSRDRRLVKAADAARMAMQRIERAYRNPDDVTGVRTGLVDLDELLGGFQAGELIVLAARPAMGKTALILNLLEGAAIRYGKRVLLFELEMSAEQLGMRGVASAGRISLQRLKRGALTEHDFARLYRGANEFSQAQLVIDETPTATLADVRTVARQMKMNGGLDLIAIDYLQLMSSERDRDNREREVAEISRGLKQMAKDLGVPVIALSQLNRKLEDRAEKRPQTADLRESGAIEQDADVIMFLYRDEVYHEDTSDKGIAEVIVAKQRNGPTDTVKLRFDPELQRFDNLEGPQ